MTIPEKNITPLPLPCSSWDGTNREVEITAKGIPISEEIEDATKKQAKQALEKSGHTHFLAKADRLGNLKN